MAKLTKEGSELASTETKRKGTYLVDSYQNAHCSTSNSKPTPQLLNHSMKVSSQGLVVGGLVILDFLGLRSQQIT